MYSVSHGKMKTTEPGTDLKAEGPLGVASLLVGAWAVPQRPNAWVFDSTCGKTLDELNKLVLSLPATIAPKPIARPRLDSDVEAVGQFLKSSFSGQSRASDWCWLKGCGETLSELDQLSQSLSASGVSISTARPLWRGPSGDEQARHQATIVSFEFPPRLFCTHFLYAKTRMGAAVAKSTPAP